MEYWMLKQRLLWATAGEVGRGLLPNFGRPGKRLSPGRKRKMRFPACANVKDVLTEKIVTKFAAMQFLK
jgi:hypothetical protein